MLKVIGLGKREHGSGVHEVRHGSRLRAPQVASAMLLVASVLSACGDDSKSTAPPEPTNQGPTAPASEPTPTPAATPDPGATPDPSTPPSSNEGAVDGTIPLEPSGSPGASGGTPPSNEGNAPAETPPAEATPPAEETPPATPPAEPPATPAAFNPCPTDGTACRIMPLGDSITFGIASSNGAGYRLALFQQAVADGHAVTLVGRVQAGPNTNVQGQQFPTNNEGYSGATISTGNNQIANRADAALSTNPPDIILLQIGTNNLYQGMAAEVPGQLEALLDQITTDAPDALVVVAQITPLAPAGAQFNFPNNGVDAYNALIPDIVQERVDAGKHLVLVDMNTAFKSANANFVSLLSDGIHPTDTGYGIMAQTWYAAIESLLP